MDGQSLLKIHTVLLYLEFWLQVRVLSIRVWGPLGEIESMLKF
jgi:hypothetical protein